MHNEYNGGNMEDFVDGKEVNFVDFWINDKRLDKKESLPLTCETCRFRGYGTDSHYVCRRTNYWFRVNRKEEACSNYRKKRKND